MERSGSCSARLACETLMLWCQAGRTILLVLLERWAQRVSLLA